MKEQRNISRPFVFAIVLIAVASFTRLIPHPFNFTAIGAMAIFSGANFKDKRFAFLLPLIAMFITDLIIGFHFSILPVYGCFAFAVWMGLKIKQKQNILSITSASLISSTVFFLITNLPLWYVDISLYPMTLNGTLESYSMAIPFFKNQILGDLLYSGLLFGVYHFAFRKSHVLNSEKTH